MRLVAVFAAMSLAGCSLYFDGESTPTPSDEPTPEPDPVPDPTGDVVAQPIGAAWDIATDADNVYWLEQWDSPAGTIVRWNKKTHERTELAAIADALPYELELAGSYVYWTELHGWMSNGRLLGHDRLMRVAVDGAALPEIVAEEQSFYDDLTDLAAGGDRLFWLDQAGAIRSVGAADPVPVVVTHRTDLDQPRVIGTNGTDVCFRTGHPNELAPIYCADTVANTLRNVGGGFPRSLTFKDDTLYWADEEAGVVLATSDNGPETVLRIGYSEYILGLTRVDRNLFFNQVEPKYGATHDDSIRMSRPDKTLVTALHVDGFISAFAVDTDDVWAIDTERNVILRATRPY